MREAEVPAPEELTCQQRKHCRKPSHYHEVSTRGVPQESSGALPSLSREPGRVMGADGGCGWVGDATQLGRGCFRPATGHRLTDEPVPRMHSGAAGFSGCIEVGEGARPTPGEPGDVTEPYHKWCLHQGV